ncbi:hypothetical protein MPSEU_000312400 [Mayamaea pseudoterrestris]|nr:hypothetical protein MPSEU_000312400 [Mayamaea pseudoterrestris]
MSPGWSLSEVHFYHGTDPKSVAQSPGQYSTQTFLPSGSPWTLDKPVIKTGESFILHTKTCPVPITSPPKKSPTSAPKTYPTPTNTYPTPTNTYPTPTNTYPTPTNTYPTPTNTYPTPTNTYPTPTNTYPTPTNTYPTPTNTYPTPTNTYPTPTAPAGPPCDPDQCADLLYLNSKGKYKAAGKVCSEITDKDTVKVTYKTSGTDYCLMKLHANIGAIPRDPNTNEIKLGQFDVSFNSNINPKQLNMGNCLKQYTFKIKLPNTCAAGSTVTKALAARAFMQNVNGNAAQDEVIAWSDGEALVPADPTGAMRTQLALPCSCPKA